jgi:DHA2 family multidrug resistance protein-like MFS transporter
MYLTGLALFAAASLLAAFAPSPPVLIAARAFLAVGAAAMLPATLSLIRITFDDEHERGIAIGVWGTMAVLGAALGPIVGGLLLAHFWWGSVFLLTSPSCCSPWPRRSLWRRAARATATAPGT